MIQDLCVKYCIVCGKPAKIFSGHLLITKTKPIGAGFCSDECHLKANKEVSKDCNHYIRDMGCYGKYKKKYGKFDLSTLID